MVDKAKHVEWNIEERIIYHLDFKGVYHYVPKAILYGIVSFIFISKHVSTLYTTGYLQTTDLIFQWVESCQILVWHATWENVTIMAIVKKEISQTVAG